MKKSFLLFSLLFGLNLSSQTNYSLTLSGVGLQRSTIGTDSIFKYPYPLVAPYTFDTNSNTFPLPSGTYTISFGYVNWSGNTYLDIINNGDVFSYTLPPSPTPQPPTLSISITYTTIVITTTSNMNNLKFVGNFGVSGYVDFRMTKPVVSTMNVGINELNSLNVNFYSHSNSIYVDNNPGVKIDVFNLSGELLYSDTTNDSKIDLNVPNGLYIVKLSKGNQYSIKKVLIQ